MKEHQIGVNPAAEDEELPHSQHKVKYHNVIISLLALAVVPTYLYGARVIVLLFTAFVTAMALDLFCVHVFLRSRRMKYDYSGVVTALVTVMLMPATVPFWVVIISVTIGLCVAKYPFGGEGRNIFNPAAVGVAFSALCWPEYVLRYPVPFTTYSFTAPAATLFGETPESVLRLGGTPQIEFFDILLGKFSGAIGTTSILVLLACALYLLVRKVISKRIVFSAVGTVAIAAVLFPRVTTGMIPSLIYEFSSGALLFGIIFMAGDPVTTPNTKSGRIFYGVIIGLAACLFRRFGQVEASFVYALLISNIFASSCDRYAEIIKNGLGALVHHRRKPAAEKAVDTSDDNDMEIVIK